MLGFQVVGWWQLSAASHLLTFITWFFLIILTWLLTILFRFIGKFNWIFKIRSFICPANTILTMRHRAVVFFLLLIIYVCSTWVCILLILFLFTCSIIIFENSHLFCFECWNFLFVLFKYFLFLVWAFCACLRCLFELRGMLFGF